MATEDPTPPQEQTLTITLTPELIAALGLTTETATQDGVSTAITAMAETAKSAAGLQEQLAQLKEADETRKAADLDALLSGYQLDEGAQKAIRGLLSNNPEEGKALLSLMPKKTVEADPSAPPVKPPAAPAIPPKPEVKLPPAPVHEPAGKQTSAGQTQEINRLVAEYQQSHPGILFRQAWDAVRRENPQLFDNKTAA